MYTFNQLISMATERKASDLHLTAGEPACCRVYGVITPLETEVLTPAMILEIVTPLIPERLRESLEREGCADFAYSLPSVGRYRINVFRQRGSLALAARILSSDIPDPGTLSIPGSVVQMVHKRRGLVLVTGVTGAGKTTTLASLINIINCTYNHHIITLEDPIEYLHQHKKSIVNQREMGSDFTTYADALRSALRQDPDVILVGEMRDLDTISVAVTAAETGHLVFSTLHTIGAANTIDRIIDVFPPYQQQQIRMQLADVLECVVSQQLLPRKDKSGRVAAFEVMVANSAIRNHIREGKTYQIPSVIQTSKMFGMQTMDDAIYDLYTTGEITRENALTYAVNRAAMVKKLPV